MLEFKCAEKWILCVAIHDVKAMHGKIELVSDNPCGTGKIISHNSPKLKELKAGDVVYFHHQNAQPVRLENGLLHALVHEDNIMGHTPGENVYAQEKHVGKIRGELGHVPLVAADGRRVN
jgi:hypothetical protein